MVDVRLQSVITIDEMKSFSKAARKLNLTQPAISAHIHSLEKELGVALFLRGQGFIKTTQAGQTVVVYAKRILSLYENMIDKIELGQSDSFPLNIGVTHSAQNSILVEAIAKYASDHIGVKINLVTGHINDLYKQLDEYALDLAFIEGRIDDPSFQSVRLSNDSLVLALSPNHPLAKRRWVTLDQLRKENLILRPKGSSTRELFDASLESKGLSTKLDFHIIVESESLGIIKDLVSQNIGVSILSKASAMEEQKRGKLILLPIRGLPMDREVNILFQKDFDHKEAVHDIVSYYNEAIA